MSDIVIKVEDLSKQYRLGNIGTGSIVHDINRWFHRVRGNEDPYLTIGEENDRTKKSDGDYVWALKNINFEVKQGEVLGIIGRNGAGKSTMLKILSKVTQPTGGQLKIKGRIASLLEVGTGFHPELTGRENVFLNGAILGMTKTEIKNKFDEIVDFAGVQKYIDTPVKRYSSGMYVRLAFGVAAHLEPEILIVDEVLAVGDTEFQRKALGKMKDVSTKDGRTILFVSHSMPSVKNLCTTGLLLKNGTVAKSGTSTEIVDYYIANFIKFNESTFVNIDDSYRVYKQAKDIEFTKIQFKEVQEANQYAIADSIDIIVTVKANRFLSDFRIGLGIYGIDESCVGVFFTKDNLNINQDETKNINIIIRDHQLAKGQYYIDMSVGIGNEVAGIRDYDHVSKTLFFEIAYKDIDHNEMVAVWNADWGKINFQNIEIREL